MKLRDMCVLIKPASSLCDMHCAYCFYRDEAEHRAVPSYGLMTRETAAVLIARSLAHARQSCTFLFQGGEPTLAGFDFFRWFVEEVKRQNTARTEIHYALQTNGQRIDREWAEFFRKNDFLIGVSLDGTAEIHDRLRGEGTHKRVMRSAAVLRSCGVEFNILTVVTAKTARNTEAVYNFFKRQGFANQQYIPCLDTADGESFLTAEEYGRFLVRLFRLWKRDAVSSHPVSVRYFDELILMLLGNRPGSCGMSGVCSLQYVIESNGDVYPCDFYCTDKYLLGNISEEDFETIDERRISSGFLDASVSVDETCCTCPHYMLCRGGCRRDRDRFDGGPLLRSRLCEGYKIFFSECTDDIRLISRMLSGRNTAGR